MGAEDEATTVEQDLDASNGVTGPGGEISLPRAFGTYVLLRKLALRPTQTIYLATAKNLGSFQRLCVVKTMKVDIESRPGFDKRFIRAARRLVHLDHRNVAQVFDSGQNNDLLFLAQEFVCGVSLNEIATTAESREQSIPIDLAVLMVVDMLRGLYHGIRQLGPQGIPLKLWHGKLSPNRVMVSVSGEVKIIGFDREWDLDFSPEDETMSSFAAPELDEKSDGDQRADVYSAAKLTRLLLGAGHSESDTDSLLEEIKPGLGALIGRALSPDPEERPKDVGALLRPLRASLFRLNARCGPPDLEDYLFGLVGDVLEQRVGQAKRLLKAHASVERSIVPSPAATRTLLLDADEPVRARAVDRVVGEDAPLTGMLPGTKYKILRPIGEGGMGTVYAAEHVDLEKVFALKILREKKQKERSNVVEGLRREAKATSKLGHPNIVSVTDFGETPDGRVFFVMEYLEGRSFGELLEERATVEQDTLIEILTQVCDGLAAAHEKGVIHRDIKPDNIFLIPNRDGTETVKLLDFGVAVPVGTTKGKRTHIAGTPYYMSPEMIRMKPLDGRADLYSLGVLAYEALVGKRPFGPAPVLQLLRCHLKEEPKPLSSHVTAMDVHPDLESIIMRCLKKKPSERFPDAQTMARELRALKDLVRESRDDIPSFQTVSFDSAIVQHDIDETWAQALSELDRPAGETGGDEVEVSVEASASEPPPRRTPLWMILGAVGIFSIAASVFVFSFIIDGDGSSSRADDAGRAAIIGAPAGDGGVAQAQIVDAAQGSMRAQDASAQDGGAISIGDGGSPIDAEVGDADRMDLDADTDTGGGNESVRPSRSALARAAVTSAQQALASGSLGEAEREFRRALALNPRRVDAVAGLGRVEFQRGNYDRAEHFARRALERAPNSARFRLDLGAALFRQGRITDARVLFRQVLADDPSNRAAQRYLEATQRNR